VRSLITVVLIAVGLFGCKRTNELYCDDSTPCARGVCNVDTNECEQTGDTPDAATTDAPVCNSSLECVDDGQPICDDTSGACRGCLASPECAAKDEATPECTGDGRCVECTDHAQCTDAPEPICRDDACAPCASGGECIDRDPAAPVCAPTGACVQCWDHGDCASSVCDRETHTCVAAADVIYVDVATGTDGGGCGDVGSPCKTIVGGVDEVTASRSTLRITAGIYAENALTVDGVDVALIGPSVTVTPTNTDRAVLLVQGGAAVLADGLTFRNASGNPDADGVRCTGAGTSVRLERVIVSNNDASGLEAAPGCVLAVVQSEVARNSLYGVEVDTAELSLARSEISENRAGGVNLENSPFTILNNFIIGNGSIASGGSLIGGVYLRQDVAYSPQQFEFNTVVENLTGSSAQASGVFCFAVATARNNIVYGGVGSPAVAGTCTWGYSDVEGVALGGTNLDEPPQFVDVSMGNYHLQPTSPAHAAGDPPSAVDVDYDGDDRPLGAGFDIGADELLE